MRPELVVFDIAGTTVRDDDGVGSCFTSALNATGLRLERATVNRVMGLPKPVAIRYLLTEAGNRIIDDRLVAAVHQDFVTRMIRFYSTEESVAAMPGAEELFVHLRRQSVKVALNTGFSRDIVEVLLGRLGWDVGRTVDAIVCSDEVEKGRPAPDLILEAMRQTGVTDPAKVAKVGDTPSDIAEGLAAGCGWIIAITHGTHNRDELAAHHPTHFADSLAEVGAILRQG